MTLKPRDLNIVASDSVAGKIVKEGHHGSSGKPHARGEDPRVNELVAASCRLDATAVDSPALRTTIDALLKKTQPELYDWASDSLRDAESLSNDVVTLARDLAALNVDRWIDEARGASSKTPSLLDRLFTGNGPSYYRARLDGVRTELTTHVLPRATATKTAIERIQPSLTLSTQALIALFDSIQNTSDALLLSTVSNRVRTLQTAQLNLLQIERQCEDARVTVDRFVTTIDQLNVVINNWALAQTKR